MFVQWLGPNVKILEKGKKKTHHTDVRKVLQVSTETHKTVLFFLKEKNLFTDMFAFLLFFFLFPL